MSLPPLGGQDVPIETLRGRPWRVYASGWRIHHGPVGILLMLVGLLLLASDWHDRPWRPRPRRLSVEEHDELRQG